MSITNVNNIQNRISEGIKTLSPEQQYQVLNFIQSLSDNSQFEKWDDISYTQAQALKDEFAQEDIDFAEDILPDYKANLEREEEKPEKNQQNAWDILEDLVGTYNAPEDWSSEHNYYLYGTSKSD